MLPTVTPEAVGFSSERLRRLDGFLKEVIDHKEYPGVVIILARHGKVVHFEAMGWEDIEHKKPMSKDTIFRIASMTKPVTGAAMMLLYEEGKWNPQDPISKYVPAFARLKVYKETKDSDQPMLVDPEHPPTMRELMTHTAGFSYGFSDSPVDKLYRGEQGRSIFECGSIQALIDRVANAPLNYQPSTRWEYSLSTDIQGYVIEKLSGMTLPEFMKKRLFEPLSMNDTGFYVPEEKRSRFATVYAQNDKGELVAKGSEAGLSYLSSYDHEPSLPAGGAGLVSTAADFYRFAQMLLNGGELNDVRLLGPRTVKLMMSNHLADNLTAEYHTPITNRPRLGMGYGYDGAVVVDPGKADVPMGTGTYTWDGAFGTWFWIDPVNDIVFVGLTQNTFWFNNPKVANLQELSRALTYQALIKPEL